MSLSVAIQVDDPASWNPRTDSTLLLGLEAQARGHRLYYYTPQKLSFSEGALHAKGHAIRFFDDKKRWYEEEEETLLDLAGMDVVLVRQNPPFDMAYLTSLYLLESLGPDTRVCNAPAALRNRPEKWFAQSFADAVPPTLISRDADAIRAFHREQQEIVMKPLYGYGGRSVFHIARSGDNLEALLEHAFAASPEPWMFQRFLPEVAREDKRVILIDGKVEGVLGRIPAEGEVRANFRVGGTAAPATLNARQKEICERVGVVLKAEGVLFAGLDLIGDWLTEINITSPTGLRGLLDLYGQNAAVAFWDAL